VSAADSAVSTDPLASASSFANSSRCSGVSLERSMGFISTFGLGRPSVRSAISRTAAARSPPPASKQTTSAIRCAYVRPRSSPDKAFPTTSGKRHSEASCSDAHPDSDLPALSSTELPFQLVGRMFCSCLFFACSVATRPLASTRRMRVCLGGGDNGYFTTPPGRKAGRSLADEQQLRKKIIELRQILPSAVSYGRQSSFL
jgi:hypothetical protein